MRTPSGLFYPRAITSLVAAVLFAACGGGDVSLPPDGQPATLTILDGDGQTGRVGDPLAVPLLVELTDARGKPVEGATLAFEFSSAGPDAAVIPEQKVTNGDGLADAKLVLGTTIGRQTGRVRVVAPAGSEAVQAEFSAMATPKDANSMAAAGGEDQTGHVLQPLDDRLVVEVTDGFGNPVAGVPITWEAAGGGSVSESVVPTDEDGRSRVERILGPTVGQQTTLASSQGVDGLPVAGSPVVFVHTAVAGDARRLTIVSGDDQTAEVGSLLPAELVVRLIDSEGNGVPNTAVTWVPAIGGGSPNPQNTTTDADGRTSTQWTLGPALGGQRMDAVVSGVGVASFTATATAGAPPSLFILTQPSGTARNGIPFDRQPVIQLRDPQGNAVAAAGVLVTATLNGGGELEGTTRQTTDASGRATFDDLAIAGAPGVRTLTFEAVGYAAATSDEVVLSSIGTTTTITGDSPDPSQVGTAFTVSFRVESEGPTPTGSVTVSDGAQSCTGTLSNGAGSCQLSLNTVGERALTATYSGGPGLNGSSGTAQHTVTAAPPPPPAATTTTITDDNPDPTVSGTTFTVRFTVTSTGGIPGGSVTVTVSDGSPTCTGTLSNGSGSCQLTLNTAGNRTLTASYSGATGFLPSSDSEPHTVTAAQPSNQGPTAEFTWECDELECEFDDQSSDPDGGINDRQWDFGDGETSGGREPRHEYDDAGTYTVRLTVTDNDGATATVTHTVIVSEDAASTSTRFEVDDPDPTTPGQSFTVTLSVRSNDGTPEGTATVSDGVDGCTITITGGSGSCTLALTTVGDRTLTATFQGNASFATSSANEEHRVNPAPPAGTTTTITSDTPDPSEFGQTVTVGFTVFSAGGTPTGTVQISDGVGGGCTTDVSAGSCNYAPAGIGTRIITATYSGSSVFSGSTDTEEHTVNRPPTAAFTAPNCTVGQQCQFTDASNDPDGEIASRAWSFEGGTPGSSTLEDPSVTFATEGPKTVTLTVTDDDGAANTVAQPVTVAPAPGALGIRSQPPQRVESGDRLEPEVELLDGGRNAMALKGVQVSVRIASALGDVRLDGETTRPTDEKGRARFENLRVRGDEDDSFVLAFSAPGFSPVDSQRISIEDD